VQRSTPPENGGESGSGLIPENNFTKIQEKALTFFVNQVLLAPGKKSMKIYLVSDNRRALAPFLTALLVLPACVLLAQGTPPLAKPGKYTGRNISGDLVRGPSVNIADLASAPTSAASSAGAEIYPNRRPVLRPPVRDSGAVLDRAPAAPQPAAAAPTPSFRGFTGLTHLEERTARNGNQFSTEPPDQGLAVGNGFVLEAVNSALNVYDTNGIQQLLRPVALSEFFGLPPAINRTTNFFGVFPGDPVALFDPETQRWFVAAWAQLNTATGFPLQQSRLYLAVSQTSDPTGTYSIYTLNTTLARDPDQGGPRIPDFPHFAVDHYGLYISINEFNITPEGTFDGFIGAAILAISKNDLINGTGGSFPRVVRFPLPLSSGFEFTVFPAYTPPGGGPLLANGGTQFFVSSRSVTNNEHTMAIWALTNTSSLDSATPNLDLRAVVVETQPYHFPSAPAVQKKGFHPLGASLGEPVEKLNPDDFRVVSATYSSGRLWATLSSQMLDTEGAQRTVAAYFAFSPNINGPFFTATLVTQGVVSKPGANLLYPAIAVNAQQKGGIVFTLVGPNDYPSAAFVPVNNNTIGAIQIARAGNEPEDGFTGYRAFGGNGVARWGDYSAAAVDTDGVIWMATEYTPDIARTSFANWCTYITRLQP
jgi:hypothetical protein